MICNDTLVSKLEQQYKSSIIPCLPYYSGIAHELPFYSGLEINDYGRVSLPITLHNINSIRDYFSIAPYGKGYDTVIDEKVRKCLELSSDKFSFKNKLWDQKIQELTIRTAKELGIKKDIVSIPYKLLLYEEGSYFLPHQDTEKEKGMFATLIVQLPSIYSGGELIMHLPNKSEKCNLGVNVDNECEFNNFFSIHYADLKHEIKPLTSGYRLAITYSVCWTHSDSNSVSLNSILSFTDPLEKYLLKFDGEEAYFPFSHSYTLSGLSGNGFHALKGYDRKIVDRLLYIQHKLKPKCFEMYLMIVERTADMIPSGYNEWEEQDGNNEVLIFDIFGNDADEYFEAPDDIDDWADEKDIDYEEYSGNAGPTKTTRYRQTFLIIERIRSDIHQKIYSKGIDKYVEDSKDSFLKLSKEEQENILDTIISEMYSDMSKNTMFIIQDHIIKLNNIKYAERILELNLTNIFNHGILKLLHLLKPWENKNIQTRILNYIKNRKKKSSIFIINSIPDEYYENSNTNITSVISEWLNCFISNYNNNQESKISTHYHVAAIFICSLSSSPIDNFVQYCNKVSNIVSVLVTSDKELLKLPRADIYILKLRKKLFEIMGIYITKDSGDINDYLYYLQQVNTFDDRDLIANDVFTYLKSHPDKFRSIVTLIINNKIHLLFKEIINKVEEIRILTINNIQKTTPVGRWSMPNASLSSNMQNSELILNFLHSNQKTLTIKNIFTSIHQARSYKIRGSKFSVSCTAGGRGKDSYVTITKTPELYNKLYTLQNSYKKYLEKLNSLYPSSDTTEGTNIPILPLKRDGSHLETPQPKKHQTDVIDLS